MPLHPIFVHFPLALVVVAFFADLIGFARHRPTALSVGWHCLWLGLVGAVIAIATGYADMERAALQSQTHELVDVHLKTGIVVGVLLLGLTIWRARLRRRGPETRAAGFLVSFALVLGLLTFQGWYGGELAYSHGAGVAAAGQGMEPPNRAQQRLEGVANAIEKFPGFGAEKEDQHEHQSAPAE